MSDALEGQTKGTVLPLLPVNLQGKVVIVTGANQGVGYETAMHLAAMKPFRLILAVRNIEAGKVAAKRILASTGLLAETWHLDLADWKTVRAFVEQARALDRLDILISNAGVAKFTKEITVDGLDLLLQVNNIAQSYLCASLLPLLQSSAPAHLVITSSGAHRRSAPIEARDGKSVLWTISTLGENGTPYMMYPTTKALNILESHKLAELAGPSVMVSAVNPGLCESNLSRDATPEFKAHHARESAEFGWSAEMGARNLVWAATQDTPSPAYISGCKVIVPSEFMQSADAQRIAQELWADYEKVWAGMKRE